MDDIVTVVQQSRLRWYRHKNDPPVNNAYITKW